MVSTPASSSADAAPSAGESAPDPRPFVISVCGTFLKPEMRSIYRQVTGLQRVRSLVYTQSLENREMFPHPAVVKMTKLHHRTKGNFIIRFWYKYVVRQWPPPVTINKYVGPCHPYDMPERLRADQPDLVHVYYGHKAVRFLGMLQDWGGPWIVSFHGVDAAKFLDQPGYLEQLREVFQTALLVLARSQSLLDRLRDLGCPPEKLRLNRTPIPLGHLACSPHPTPADGTWRLVQACRLIPKKGILTTLQALQTVVRTWPRLRYVLCGDGPQMEAIRARIHELGLEHHVEMRGWLRPEALHEEYQRAHLFLHPSELTPDADQEGIPNSMLEAMATGLPVIATRHGGIPEAVTSGEDGLLVAERAPEELAAAILQILRDETLRTRLGENAARSVREHFDSEAQIARLEELYLEAIRIAQAAATEKS
jgi:colanic acid/amylovoran biosynthesis glycosyltransferase